MADFHSKMSVCRHELGVQPSTLPTTIPTLRTCIYYVTLNRSHIKCFNPSVRPSVTFSGFTRRKP